MGYRDSRFADLGEALQEPQPRRGSRSGWLLSFNNSSTVSRTRNLLLRAVYGKGGDDGGVEKRFRGITILLYAVTYASAQTSAENQVPLCQRSD